MRKFLLFAAVAAAAMTILPPTAPALAVTAATSHDVLTITKVGGTNVTAKAHLHAVLGTHQVLTFTVGSVTLTCKQSTLAGTVSANPARPGTAVVSPTLAAGSCTALGVNVTMTFAEKKLTISDAKGGPVVVSPLTVTFSAPAFKISCAFSASSIAGNASNTGSTVTFKNQVLTQATPSCPIKGSGKLTAVYGPVLDESVSKNPSVFVN